MESDFAILNWTGIWIIKKNWLLSAAFKYFFLSVCKMNWGTGSVRQWAWQYKKRGQQCSHLAETVWESWSIQTRQHLVIAVESVVKPWISNVVEAEEKKFIIFVTVPDKAILIVSVGCYFEKKHSPREKSEILMTVIVVITNMGQNMDKVSNGVREGEKTKSYQYYVEKYLSTNANLNRKNQRVKAWEAVQV